MVQLKCLGAKPYGKFPVFVVELGGLIQPQAIVSAKDDTFAQIILDKYEGCFVRVETSVPKAAKEQERDKMLPKGKTKDKELDVWR